MTNLTTREIATINSKEVAEMMETRHDNLMRKIEGINKDFSDHKIEVANYWIEGEYLDAQKKPRKCYEVTKMGCEFLAHKSTGTKGNIFTAKYMQRFNEMEKELQNRNIESYRIADPIERAKKWIEEETIRQEQAKLLEEQKPVVDYAENVLTSNETLNTTQIAQDYGMSAVKFNKVLHELGIQYKSNKQWILYADYKDKGYVESETITLENGKVVTRSKWTHKGRKFLYEILKENGYTPVKELN